MALAQNRLPNRVGVRTLGMQWRGYFDFGVAMQDFRAAIKSKGEV